VIPNKKLIFITVFIISRLIYFLIKRPIFAPEIQETINKPQFENQQPKVLIIEDIGIVAKGLEKFLEANRYKKEFDFPQNYKIK
jgi:hypothetical protein